VHREGILQFFLEIFRQNALDGVLGVVMFRTTATLDAASVVAVTAHDQSVVCHGASFALANAQARGAVRLVKQMLHRHGLHAKIQRTLHKLLLSDNVCLLSSSGLDNGESTLDSLRARRRVLKLQGTTNRLVLLRDEVVRHQRQRREHASANDCRRHRVTRKIAHLIFSFARQEQVVNGDSLQTECFDANQRTTSVGDERHHRRCQAWANTRRDRASGAIHVLREVPNERLVHRVNVQLSQSQVINVHQVEHSVSLRLAPVIPRIVWHRAATIPVRERASLTQALIQSGALMARFASTPVSVRSSGIFTRTRQHASTLVDAMIIRVEEEGFKRRTRWSLESFDVRLPLLDERSIISLASKQVDSRSSVRNVETLCIDSHKLRVVTLIIESLRNLVPRRVAHVLQDDDRRLALSDPVHHPSERLPGFTLRVQSLAFVVQVGVINARSTRHQHVDVVGHINLGAVSCGGLVTTQFTNVSEEDGRRKVSLNVRLLERFDFAREHVVDRQPSAIELLGGVTNLVEREKRRLGAGAHRRDANRSLHGCQEGFHTGNARYEIDKHLTNFPDNRQVLGELDSRRRITVATDVTRRVRLALQLSRSALARRSVSKLARSGVAVFRQFLLRDLLILFLALGVVDDLSSRAVRGRRTISS